MVNKTLTNKILITLIVKNKNFVLSGGLKTIQQKANTSNPKLRLCIEEINGNFPQEIVQYYSPDYAETLIKKLDEYNQ